TLLPPHSTLFPYTTLFRSSFYTFQTMSYSIDVYKRKLEPTKDFIAFSAFVSFFPQLVAGPIERATHLLPQFYKKRTFDYSKAVEDRKSTRLNSSHVKISYA